MNKIYIKNWEPPYDSGLVASKWINISREYSPNDEGVLDLSNCDKVKFLCYPYGGLIKMYMYVEPWSGGYWEKNGKWYYECDTEKMYSSYPPYTYINITDEWVTIKIDWNFSEIPKEVRSELTCFSLYFIGQGAYPIGIKLESLWSETIDQDYAFIA